MRVTSSSGTVPWCSIRKPTVAGIARLEALAVKALGWPMASESVAGFHPGFDQAACAVRLARSRAWQVNTIEARFPLCRFVSLCPNQILGVSFTRLTVQISGGCELFFSRRGTLVPREDVQKSGLRHKGRNSDAKRSSFRGEYNRDRWSIDRDF